MDIDTWRMSLKTDIMTMVRAPRERMRWVTLILAVYIVRVTDDPSADVATEIEQFRHDWRACAMRSGTIKRGTRWAGAIEFDLLLPKMMGSQTKQDLIGQLAGIDPDTLAPDQRAVVVHLHAVVDYRGHEAPDDHADDMRECWSGPRRVHSAKIYTDGTVRDNLENLAEYSGKLRFQYSQSWEGKRTKFYRDYEPEWKAWMRRLIDTVGLDNMLISSVTSRAAERPLANAQTFTTQGVEPISEGQQLRASIDDEETPQHPLNHTETITERQTMRMREIINTDPIPTQYIDLDRISDEMLRDLQRSLTRSGGPVRTPDLVQAMYSHADDDRRDRLELDLLALDVEARRADIAATQAETDQSHADATKSRAAALIDLGDLDEFRQPCRRVTVSGDRDQQNFHGGR